MKPIKFKKWIITAIVSFIFTVIFLIFSVIAGGASMVHMMNNNDWNNNYFRNQEMMNQFGSMMRDDQDYSLNSWAVSAGNEQDTCSFNLDSDDSEVEAECFETVNPFQK